MIPVAEKDLDCYVRDNTYMPIAVTPWVHSVRSQVAFYRAEIMFSLKTGQMHLTTRSCVSEVDAAKKPLATGRKRFDVDRVAVRKKGDVHAHMALQKLQKWLDDKLVETQLVDPMENTSLTYDQTLSDRVRDRLNDLQARIP